MKTTSRLTLRGSYPLLFVLYFASLLHAHAGDIEKPPLKIATIPLAPWGYTLPSGELTGINYEFENAIAERMARKAENTILPMARIFKQIENGQSDFTIMLRTPSSEKISVLVANIGLPLRTIVWPRKGLSVKSLDDLKDIRIAVTRGLKVGDEFDKRSDFRIARTDDYANSIRLFAENHVNAIVGTYEGLRFNAIKYGLNPEIEFDEPYELARLDIWLQASHQYIEREGSTEIQKAVQSLAAEGVFSNLHDKHVQNMPFLLNSSFR